jgi:hypothetical protein
LRRERDAFRVLLWVLAAAGVFLVAALIIQSL